MVNKARTVVMLMDLSKADKSLPYTFCRLEQVQTLICNGPLPRQLQEQAMGLRDRNHRCNKSINQEKNMIFDTLSNIGKIQGNQHKLGPGNRLYNKNRFYRI